MADINIEKKKNKKPVWPWILAALVLIGVIWAIAEMGGDDAEVGGVATVEEPYEEESVVREPQANRMAESPETANFVSYVNDNEIKDRIGEDHQVTGEALIMLSAALDELSQNNNAYSQQISEIRQAGQEIQTDPQSTQHADKVKNAFTNAANVLGQIQQNQYPDAQSEVEDVQKEANEIETDKQLAEQKDQVEEFFEKTADAIEKMEENQASAM